MNSDPHDSTAWRSFGMLDADESAAFDEAARHDPQLKAATREMDRLQAALALAVSQPVMPREGHLERIQARLGQQPKRPFPLWLGVSGWATAAALALLLVWNADVIRVFPFQPASPTAFNTQPTIHRPSNQRAAVSPANTASPDSEPDPIAALSPDANAPSLVIRRETERLTQEIAALQDQLQSYQLRDQQRFQALPGVATPVIMVMSPPGTPVGDSGTLALNDSPISVLLSETSRVASTANPLPEVTSDAIPPSGLVFQNTAAPLAALPLPSAIPIYDAARDSGTLVVTHLPPASQDMEYNLWVQTSPDAKPARLGILPDAGTSPSESFDFSLGSHTVMPSGFILTQDPIDAPAAPDKKNTVLQSPQAPQP